MFSVPYEIGLFFVECTAAERRMKKKVFDRVKPLQSSSLCCELLSLTIKAEGPFVKSTVRETVTEPAVIALNGGYDDSRADFFLLLGDLFMGVTAAETPTTAAAVDYSESVLSSLSPQPQLKQ